MCGADIYFITNADADVSFIRTVDADADADADVKNYADVLRMRMRTSDTSLIRR